VAELLLRSFSRVLVAMRRAGASSGCADVLCVECTKCDRKGRYQVHKLIEKHGRKGNLSKWVSDLKSDCPNRDSRLHDRCDLVMPDLPKVL
jgi:hypothetical protein